MKKLSSINSIKKLHELINKQGEKAVKLKYNKLNLKNDNQIKAVKER